MGGACGGADPSATTPSAAPVIAPAPARAADPACPTWRFAVVAGPFEVADTIARAELAARWRRGEVAATPEAEVALAPLLGARAPVPLAPHASFDAAHWGVVPVHQLSPAWSVVPVDGHHPLDGDGGPLVARVCGHGAGVDPAHLTTLVMSGTTALTGRTAERIDQHGIADTIQYLAPFFTSADLGHLSNEVAFVEHCQPWTGQAANELKFCSRDSYIELIAALHVTIIELTGSHLIDYGHAALERTLDMYERRGWVWFGGGRTQLEATAPRIVEHHGNKLAFLGCNHVNWWIDRIFVGSGGANCDYARMVWQIHDLRRRGYTVIASVQHRELLTHKPDWDLVADLRGLAEAGATFVEGSQAHVAHPWDVHHGAFVHYGPGNTLFAQGPEVQRDAAIDKLYLYEGRLLTVARLLIRSEHGQARTMTAAERARFLAQMAAAEAAIAPAAPWVEPALPPETRDRPDSMVARGKSQKLAITVPRDVRAGATYPLVIELDGEHASDDDAFVVRRHADITGKWLVATGPEIAKFMIAKYPIDPERVRVTDDPAMKAVAWTAGPKPPPPPVIVANAPPPPPPPPKPAARVAVVEPLGAGVSIALGKDGRRWVRHRHHHELDYAIDEDGHRVPR